MLNLDHFKRINDSFGHPVGDTVLQSVACAYRRVLRRIDAIGRFGGEEFGILLADAPLAQAMACAEWIRQSFAELRICPTPTSPLPPTSA
jgi:two-component system cell cycle response regulator